MKADFKLRLVEKKGAGHADPELSVLVLDIQILHLANHCPTKSWGGGKGTSAEKGPCFQPVQSHHQDNLDSTGGAGDRCQKT
jgi:hypothetical protein